jgi:protein-tyrosine phosphatase
MDQPIMAETISNPPFTSIHNFRDVGKVINSQPSTEEGSRRILKEGVLLRSGRLDEATETDAQLLLKEYRIKTVIDLRTKTEHVKRKEVVSQRQQRAVEWNTVKIHFIGRKFEMNLLRQLRWWQVIWVILLMLIRRRIAAIHVMGRNVMSPRGLVGLSQDSLQFCQSEILQVCRFTKRY